MNLDVRESLKLHFGYDEFRPQQENIIRSVLEGKDVFVLMPTGGGKSICYQLPAMLRQGMAIVISPLIALMKDQVQALRQNGITAAYINSSLHQHEINDISHQCLQAKIKLLYLAPETFIQLKTHFLPQLEISFFAIDEAHCISTWGHDFRPEYQQLNCIKSEFPNAQIIALTATCDRVTKQDILRQLNMEHCLQFVSSFDRPNLHLEVIRGAAEIQKLQKIASLHQKYPNESGIVYCLSRKTTEQIAEKLQSLGMQCKAYHAGLPNSERSLIQDEFMEGKIKLIVATVAFGMGIDKSDVRYIVHINLPKSMESYYQEIGRAGRDGQMSETVLFYNLADLIMLKKFAMDSSQQIFHLEKLKLIQQYAEARHCRRKILINYFGEQREENCNFCDICENPPKFVDGTVLAQQALSAIVRTGETEASGMIIQILRRAATKELLAKNYHLLKTYGVGLEHSNAKWQSYLLQLLQLGAVELDFEHHFALKITDFGKDILYGKKQILFTEFELLSDQKNKNIPKNPDVESDRWQDQLFQRLRSLRKSIAEAQAVAPFIILHDSSLKKIVELLPTQYSEMIRISGFSQNKMAMYGNEFINVVVDFLKEFPELKGQSHRIELTDQLIESWVNTMREEKIELKHTILANLLYGNSSVAFLDSSLFGIAGSQFKKSELQRELKLFFTKNVYQKFKEEAQSFFNEDIVLNSEQVTEYIKSINRIPLQQQSDDPNLLPYKAAARKEFRRAFEPWTAEEKELFEQMLEECNSMDQYCAIFGRSPKSISAYYENYAKQRES
ncbi:MAG TPA: DNA helicase RecQ [Saprospiraceae bacterium]|nr:DNA helicase RecQ [Saprospiraceae bacterium]